MLDGASRAHDSDELRKLGHVVITSRDNNKKTGKCNRFHT